MSGREVIGLLLELFSWIGITVGIVCLFVALMVRMVSGRWSETTAVIVPEEKGTAARWMSDDGTIFSRRLDTHETEQLAGAEEPTVYVSYYRPEQMRLHRRGNAEQTFMFLGLVLSGVGLLASIVSLALMFIPD